VSASDDGGASARIPGAKGLQVQGPRYRPPGGTIGFGFTAAALLELLNKRADELTTRRALRAQLRASNCSCHPKVTWKSPRSAAAMIPLATSSGLITPPPLAKA
jgi:hypothetical protein